jgi:hypothetical protein
MVHRVPEEEIKVRGGPYTVRVGYVEDNGSFKVVGHSIEKDRPSLVPRDLFKIDSNKLENIEAQTEDELIEKINKVI